MSVARTFRENFLTHFPPPQYINVPVVGVVFSDTSLRMLLLDRRNHPAVFAESKLEPGTIELGQVKNEDKLVKVLGEKKSLFNTPFVKFAISDDNAYIFTSKIPAVAAKDMRESVRFILEENVPLPLADVSFDFAPQRVDKTANGYVANIAVVAASGTAVAAYLAVLDKAGFEPLGCMNESQAVARSVVPHDKKGISAIVQIHKKSVGIYIVNGRLVEFSTVLPVEYERAEEAVKIIAVELEKAIDYWRSHINETHKEGVLDCFLCGEYAVVETLSASLASQKEVRVQLANVWTNAFRLEETIPDIPFQDSLRYASAVGLLL